MVCCCDRKLCEWLLRIGNALAADQSVSRRDIHAVAVLSVVLKPDLDEPVEAEVRVCACVREPPPPARADSPRAARQLPRWCVATCD